MKILKLLNNKYLSIIIIFLFSSPCAFAEDQPVDIWNIDKKIIETKSDTNSLNIKLEAKTENTIYDMQVDKKKKYYKT